MFYTYTGSRNLYGTLTLNTASANLATGDTLINAEISRVLSVKPWPFLDREITTSTVANQQFVTVPAAFRKIKSVKVQQGTAIWSPKEIPNRQAWDQLNSVTPTSYTSDIPVWYYPFDGKIYFWPTPATTGGTTTVFGRMRFGRLAVADYTTGGVQTATNGSTAVVGTATVWHTGMGGTTTFKLGRWLRITQGDTANSGDDEWYEISLANSATTITLVKPYLGASISSGAGASYAIGQVSPLPDGYQELPIYRAVQIYYSMIDQTRSTYFKSLADGLEAGLMADWGSATDNVDVEETDDIDEGMNPNLFVRT